jgi:predicted permease
VILSDGLWRRQFSGDASIIGRRILLSGVARTVVGVMPPSFEFPGRGADCWAPVTFDLANAQDYEAGYLVMLGRLKPGISIERARTDVASVGRALREAFPDRYDRTFGSNIAVEPLHDAMIGRTGRMLVLLFAAVGLVLLTACVNVTNLLLARATSRQREIAVRTSLGAPRARVVRQLLTESIVLGLLGGLAGLVVAWWLSRLIAGLLPSNLPMVGSALLDVRVLAFSLGVTLLVGVGFGLVPAFRATRSDLSSTLRDSARGSTAGPAARRVMESLIVIELALGLVLAVGGLLTLRSFWKLRSEDPGFRAERVLTLSIAPPDAKYDSAHKRRAFLDAVLEREAALPGVISVGGVHLQPLGGSNWNPELVIEGRAHAPGDALPEVDWRVATPGYFRTMGIPLLRGRLFDASDRPDGPRVGVITAALAQRDFPAEDPIGKRVYTFFEGKDQWVTIIGVVGDMKDQSLARPARPQLYRPFAQQPLTSMTLMLRTDGDPVRLATAARAAVWEVDADVPIYSLEPLQDLVDASLGQPRLVMILLGLFGLLAVSLGAVGLYGVMSYAVAARTHELGVRLALGASGTQICRLVMVDGLRLAAIGIALGAVAAYGSVQALRAYLYDLEPSDPLTFAIVAVSLGLVALAASWVPARRAMRVDAVTLLR